MSLRLAPYPEYKDSGLPWLAGIPRHWRTGPGFAAFREKQVKNIGMKEKTVLSLSYGRIVVKPAERLHGLVPLSFETYQIVNPGDIIIRSTDLQNDWNSLRIGLVRDRGIITSAYLCFATTGALVPEYGYLLLHAFDLMKVFYGMGSGLRQNLDFSDFKRMVIFIPPSEEQAAIVRFLDHADRRVRRFVAAKRRLIELLNEQRQATIQRAVTRGLNPSVRFKTSGIDWLPAIPVHWSAMRLGSIAETLQTGPFGSQLHASDYQPNGTPVINPCHMDEGRLSPDRACAVGASKAAELRRHRLQSGDIVFARRGELGRCALVTPQEEGWLCGTGSLRMRTRGDLADPQF